MSRRDVVAKATVLLVLSALVAAGFLTQKPGTEGNPGQIGPVSAGTGVWVCSGLFPSAVRKQTVALANPGAEPVTGRLTLQGGGKVHRVRQLTVPGLSATSFDVGLELSPLAAPAEITSSQASGYFAVLELDTDKAAVMEALDQTGGSVTDVAVSRCSKGVTGRLDLPGGISIRGTQTDVFMANALGSDAVVDSFLATEQGTEEPSRLRKFPVLSGSQASIRISDEARRRWVIALRGQTSAGEIDLSGEVRSDGTRVGAGIARLERAPEQSSAWLFPALVEGEEEKAVAVVVNPSEETRIVKARVLPDLSVQEATPGLSPAGAAASFSVPPKEAVTFTPSPGLGEGARYGLVVESQEDKPILAAVTTWLTPPRRGLGSVTGAPRAERRWVLVGPRALGIGNVSSLQVTVMNTADRTARVKISSFGEGASSPGPGQDSFEVPPGRTSTIDLSGTQVVTGERSLVVESDLPVVAQARLRTEAGQSPQGYDTFLLVPLSQSPSPAAGAGQELEPPTLRQQRTSPQLSSFLEQPASRRLSNAGRFGRPVGQERLLEQPASQRLSNWLQGGPPATSAVAATGLGMPRGASTLVLFGIFALSAVIVLVVGGRRSRSREDDAAPDVGAGIDTAALRRLLASVESYPQAAAASEGQVGNEGRLEDGAGNGVIVFFSHKDCRACASVRELLEAGVSTYGYRLLEFEHKKSHRVFEEVGIEDVPTAIAIAPDGEAVAVKTGPIEREWLETISKDLKRPGRLAEP
jgi:hypothetical protein